MSLPPIGVMPFIGCSALYKIANLDPQAGDSFGLSKKGKDIVYPLAAAPLDEVFADVAPQEAMFVCYRRRSGGPLPRLTKACEGRIDLVADYCAFDVDLNAQFGEKGKLSWARLGEERTQVMQQRIAALLQHLAGQDSGVVCYYRSKNGLRFIHLFHEPVTTAGLEAALRRLAGLYDACGVKVDPACFDWTRCFKVPRCILEDGTQTDTQPWFQLHYFDNVTLATPEEITAQPTLGHAGDVSAEARLAVDHARELIEMDGRLTPDGLTANHAMRGDPELHGICFGDGQFMAEEGGRHLALTRLVGRLTKRLVHLPCASEQFCYALLAPKIAMLGEDEPWLDKLWGMICDYLAQDRAEMAARAVQVTTEVAEKTAPPPPSALSVFCSGVRKWFPDAVGLDDAEVVELVKSARLGIVTSQETNNNYLIQPNGFYSSYPVSPDKVALRIRETEMEWLIPTEYEGKDKKGQPTIVPRTWQNFLNDDTRTFTTTRMLCVHRGNYLTKDEADNTQFVISPFWLRDIEPEFNLQVEQWLHLLAPHGQAEDLILALAYMLAFQYGPTAALALIGPRSIGKKLIATGLAECVNTLQCAPGRVLVSRFNAGLANSPIIWVDEGLPKGKDGIDFADTFRNLVTGGKQIVEPKGKETFEVAGVHRVLITANNMDAIEQLGEGRGRTGDDLDAISERLALFDSRGNDRAADYLASIDTTGWIAGDNGAPSRFVIAKHLLWHFHNTIRWQNGAPVRLGRRLLYEGRQDSAVRATIDTAPETGIVCTAVLRAIQLKHEAVRFFQGRLWIEPVGIMSFLAGQRDRLPIDEQRKIEGALRALTTKIKREFTGTDKDGIERPLKCARWFLWQDVSRLEDSAGPLPPAAKALLCAIEVAS